MRSKDVFRKGMRTSCIFQLIYCHTVMTSKTSLRTVRKLNKVLPEYEKNMNDEELEMKVATYFYYLSKGANKQTLKFRNKEIISLFNNYVCKIETDQELKDFYSCSLIKKTQMLYSFDYDQYDQIARAYDGENVIIFIDVLQQLMNYYIKTVIDPKTLYDFFVIAKGLILLMVPNNYVYRMMFREYIMNISEYDNDDKDYSCVHANNPKGQLLLCNKCRYYNMSN
jgi:hypothetical protein